ncbi:MAG: hypothetical protein B7Z10_13040, partial [Rhodobacterales bacterium 32-66-7]
MKAGLLAALSEFIPHRDLEADCPAAGARSGKEVRLTRGAARKSLKDPAPAASRKQAAVAVVLVAQSRACRS